MNSFGVGKDKVSSNAPRVLFSFRKINLNLCQKSPCYFSSSTRNNLDKAGNLPIKSIRVKIILLVAKATNQVIGKDNQLVWKLSADLKRFKNLTTG
ncbi:MAG: hypothetical protein RJA23_1851, partial [Bacteroidota bacterium]